MKKSFNFIYFLHVQHCKQVQRRCTHKTRPMVLPEDAKALGPVAEILGTTSTYHGSCRDSMARTWKCLNLTSWCDKSRPYESRHRGLGTITGIMSNRGYRRWVLPDDRYVDEPEGKSTSLGVLSPNRESQKRPRSQGDYVSLGTDEPLPTGPRLGDD